MDLPPADNSLAVLDLPLESQAREPRSAPPAESDFTPDLRELRYFHAVARTGGFGRAARELNVTQPAVTTQVRKLEQRLGTPLLTRHGRGMVLTRSGAALMERLDVIFGLLRAPLTQTIAPDREPHPAPHPALHPAPDTVSDTVSVVMPPEFSPMVVPALLESCLAHAPELRLTIEDAAGTPPEELLLNRRADIAVLPDPPALDELVADPLITERLGLVSGARDLSLDGVKSVRFRQLAELTLILPRPRNWMRRLVEDVAFRRGVRLAGVREVDDVPLIKEMARRGLGHAILPISVAREEVARGNLTFRPIEHEPVSTVHAVAFRADRAAQPGVSAVHRALRDVLRGLVEGGQWAGASLTKGKSRILEQG